MRKSLLALVSILVLAAGTAGPARADDYDPKRAGHPLRIAAYIAHPVGVILDYLIFRPAHWIGHHEPIRTLVGHETHPADELEEAAPDQS